MTQSTGHAAGRTPAKTPVGAPAGTPTGRDAGADYEALLDALDAPDEQDDPGGRLDAGEDIVGVTWLPEEHYNAALWEHGGRGVPA